MAQRNNVHRGNIVPPGGVTTPTVGGVVGGGMIMPDTIQLQEQADVFFENSEQNVVMLNRRTLIPGSTDNFPLQTVGLGESLELWVEGSFTLTNSTAAAVTVTLPPDFPYSFLSGVSIIFNGQTNIVQSDGYSLLGLMVKRHLRSMFARSAGAPLQLDRRIADVTVGANGTLVRPAVPVGLTGASGITVAANLSTVVSFGFYLEIPFTLRRDLPLGLLPMQNTSIHANVQLQVSPIAGATPRFPVQLAAGVTVTGTPAISVLPSYRFWGLPAQPALYDAFTRVSYVVSQQQNRPITTAGAKALAFEMPINFWLISALMNIRNAAGSLVDIYSNINNPHLIYNGTILVDINDIKSRTARDMLFYGLEMPQGMLLFDNSHTGNLDSNSANMSRWLNTYYAANPTYFADIATAMTVPGNYDVTMERLAPTDIGIVR